MCFLKDKIEKRCPKILADLELFAKEEWSKIPQSYFDALVNSMPSRISQVIERNGEKAVINKVKFVCAFYFIN